MNIQLIRQTHLSTIFFENELQRINGYPLLYKPVNIYNMQLQYLDLLLWSNSLHVYLDTLKSHIHFCCSWKAHFKFYPFTNAHTYTRLYMQPQFHNWVLSIIN